MIAPDVFDPVDLLHPDADATDHGPTITRVAAEHGMAVTVIDRLVGPSVTRYRLQVGRGVRPDRLASLVPTWDAAVGVEVRYVGGTSPAVEVPNERRAVVQLAEVLDLDMADDAPLTIPVGIGTDSNPIVQPLWKLPHLLIAGATGQGKSVYMNAVLVALLAQAGPSRLRLAMIDPKKVELAAYESLPHLIAPIATDVDAARGVLAAVTHEMDARYDEMRRRRLKQYDGAPLVLVIDELADLMQDKSAAKTCQPAIVRVAQVGRAAGVHLVTATQYPKAEVITPLIKQNIPTRIAFRTMDFRASQLILGPSGAETLAGDGDGMILRNGTIEPLRFQAPLVTRDEIDRAVAQWAVPPAPPVAPVVDEAAAREHAARVADAERRAQEARQVLAGATESVAPAARLSIEEELRLEITARLREGLPRLEEENRQLRERVEFLEEILRGLVSEAAVALDVLRGVS